MIKAEVVKVKEVKEKVANRKCSWLGGQGEGG